MDLRDPEARDLHVSLREPHGKQNRTKGKRSRWCEDGVLKEGRDGQPEGGKADFG